MALTPEDLQAIAELLQPIKEQQEIHTRSITKLENSVMHELEMLNENLPDALARREAFEDVAAKVDDHGNRIFALEQKVSNG